MFRKLFEFYSNEVFGRIQCSDFSTIMTLVKYFVQFNEILQLFKLFEAVFERKEYMETDD